MAVKSSGALSFTDLTTEFGGGNPISLSQFYRGGGRVPNGSAANAGVPTSGTISLSQMYSTIKELIVTVAGNTTNYNFLNAINATYGTVTQAVVCRLVVNSGVTIGATDPGQNALVIGDFPDGSIITIDNYGSIQGSGGWGGGYYSAGGQGGTAIYAAYANQTMTINNFGGASIYAGGGGGGSGGWGGTGGTGGGGWYNYWGAERYDGINNPNPHLSGNAFIWWPQTNTTYARWDGVTVGTAGGEVGQIGNYLRGGYRQLISNSSGGENPTTNNFYMYGIHRLETAYTGGGAGGGGGTGGAGGRGIGYGNGNNAPAGGNGGAPGAGGGTNAGSGGYGGTGGSGGWGGGWGAGGSQGATGNTGATGNAGNNGGGSPGAGGGGGAGGGNPGYYLYRNGAPVTLNNSGGLAGWNG